MGWLKQGKGFNSSTGQAAVIGLHTGKILDYATKNNTCRTCEYARRIKKDPPKHDYRRNHSGSSKSMEPLSSVEHFNNVSKHGMTYSTIVTRDMVGKLGELQSVYNELQFNVETASPCTNLLKFC